MVSSNNSGIDSCYAAGNVTANSNASGFINSAKGESAYIKKRWRTVKDIFVMKH